MAYAAPVAPQGAILGHRCSMGGCRIDDPTPSPSPTPQAASGSTDRIAMLSNIITQLLALMGTNDNTPSNDPQPSTTVVTVASSTSAAPASDPTGA